jgi:uncharacterized membrane protein
MSTPKPENGENRGSRIEDRGSKGQGAIPDSRSSILNPQSSIVIAAPWTDHQVDQSLGNLLRAGVVLAAVTVLGGGVLYLARHGTEPTDYRDFQGEPADLCSPIGIVADALALQGRGLIQLGLLLLIATPVARVAFSVFAFARQRDAIYIAATLIVLALLLYSLFSAHL